MVEMKDFARLREEKFILDKADPGLFDGSEIEAKPFVVADVVAAILDFEYLEFLLLDRRFEISCRSGFDLKNTIELLMLKL